MFQVFITDTTTGETREWWDGFYGDAWVAPESDSEYGWTEGNFACDCNRAEAFAWAAGLDGDLEAVCGHDRYTIRVVECGVEVYEEE